MLPKDPIMFLITKEEVFTKLEGINYFYDEESNQFK